MDAHGEPLADDRGKITWKQEGAKMEKLMGQIEALRKQEEAQNKIVYDLLEKFCARFNVGSLYIMDIDVYSLRYIAGKRQLWKVFDDEYFYTNGDGGLESQKYMKRRYYPAILAAIEKKVNKMAEQENKNEDAYIKLAEILQLF
jgi:hypothetical protein